MALIDRVLRRRIAAKLEQLAAYGPFSVDIARMLNEQITVSMTYHSNAIEGSMMNQTDVDLALGGYRIPGEHTAEEIAETVGHAAAWHLVESDVALGNPMRAELILELHSLLKPLDAQRGKWRTGQVYIRGAEHLPPRASEVPGYIEEWVRYANGEATDAVEQAALHTRGLR